MNLYESFKKNYKPAIKEASLTEADKKYHYITKFGFKDGKALRDESLDDASKYLSEDDMTQYIPEELKGVVTFVLWVLDDIDEVHVDVYANRELTDEERKAMTSWIEGQNSDGLGEGFEQQSFAEAYFDPDTGDGPYTWQEVLNKVSENYDNMDSDEWFSEVSGDDIGEAIDNYISENGLEDTEEMRDRVETTIKDDPESYLSEDIIENAKQDVAQNNSRYNENEWGSGMTSMSWNVETIWLEGTEEDKPEEPESSEETEPQEEPEVKEEPTQEGPSEEDLKRIEEYRAKGWI